MLGESMPCACGTARIIDEEVLCPKCSAIPVLNPKQHALELTDELGSLKRDFLFSLQQIDPDTIIISLLREREKVAKICVVNFSHDKDKIKRWLALSYIISKYPWNGKGQIKDGLAEKIINTAEAIITIENELLRLEKGWAQLVSIGGSEKVVSTEYDVLNAIPTKVAEKYRELLKTGNEEWDDNFARFVNDEFEALKEIITQPGISYVIGEELYREVRRIYGRRLLPFLSPTNIKSFDAISVSIAAFISTRLGINFSKNEGLTAITKAFFEEYKLIIGRNFGEQNAKWYFENMKFDAEHLAGLGSTVIFETKDSIFLPYYSLFLLMHISSRWSKEQQKGEFLNYVGSSVEDLIFANLAAYEVETEHPVLKVPLLRVKHPEKNEEIADLMAFDEKNLIVVESKFRESLTLSSVDTELLKFFEKVEYIKNNLGKFGLDENLVVKPFFYVPFPPYFDWKGISLVSSIVVLSVDLYQLFKVRQLELQPKFAPITKLLSAITEPTPYAIDASRLDSSLKPDTYRIHDGVVSVIKENELEVFVTLPPGIPYRIWVQITDELYRDMIAKHVDKGDLIKMALLNLNGTWSMIQAIDYSLVAPYDKSRINLDNYSMAAILKMHSKDKDLEMIINQMFGEKTATEILAISKKWNIDLNKLVDCQTKKGQNILTGIGYLMGLNDTYSTLVQCRCGEIIAADEKTIKTMQELYPDGKILCKRCDPTLHSRLSAKLGYELIQMNYSDTADNIELQKDLTQHK